MNSQDDARALIDKIRREHSPVGYDKLSDIISNALEILSEELYDTSTHFVHELLQNADDNTYECEDPMLKFTYRPDSLRVDSNETGFTASNVQAICTIRQSTKPGNKNCTGEKGIGFKSVFKVADAVWISSNEYSFKFDKGEKFGVIAPIWAEFPEQTNLHETSFYLKLNQGSSANELAQDLFEFDPKLLLFLRKIKEVFLHVTRPDRSVWEQRINRTDIKYQSGLEIRSLTTSKGILRYVVVTHQARDLPLEKKRPGCLESDIVLAFPITDVSGESKTGVQNVYCSLPIGSYGLKFLLQGDFLLTVNRLHIDASSAWNCALRNALPRAFIEAVKKLIGSNNLKYSWPFFIPSTEVSPFFQSTSDAIIQELGQLQLIENSSGEFSKPDELFFIDPARFCDEKHQPFTSTIQNSRRYLSLNYPPWTIDSLLLLGVRNFSDEQFIDDLDRMLQNDPKTFQLQLPEWHSKLSRALLRVCETSELRKKLAKLPIIPLSNGKWVSAKDRPILLPKYESLSISLGPIIDSVDASVASDTYREQLIRKMGVRRAAEAEICRTIVKAHSSNTFNPREWTRRQLILHARFLSDYSWNAPDHIDLWFATSDDLRCKGSKLYIYDNPRNDIALTHVFNKLRQRFPVIHEDYFADLQTDSADNNGRTWNSNMSNSKNGEPQSQGRRVSNDRPNAISKISAIGNLFSRRQKNALNRARKRRITYFTDILQLSTIPRLVTPCNDDSFIGFELSEDFKFIFEKCSTSDIFKMLNDQWSYYSRWLESDNSDNDSTCSYDTTNYDSGPDGESYETENSQNEEATPDDQADTDVKDTPDDKNRMDTDDEQNSDTSTSCAHNENSEDHESSVYETSRRELINALREIVVKTSNGTESSLQETFIPHLDAIIDRDIILPIIKVHDEKNEGLKARLKYFGVTVEADVQFYIACLKILGKSSNPSIGTLAHIYEEIQSQYYGEEDIYDEFLHEPLLFSLSTSQTTGEQFGWVDSATCAHYDIDIVSEYPDCAFLFGGLIRATYKDLYADIKKAKTIQPTWIRHDIVHTLISISKGLEGMSQQKAVNAVKTLRESNIFPVITRRHRKLYRYVNHFDELCPAKDTTWLIPDHPNFWESFAGELPLLALDISEIESIQNLLLALQLDTRKLSKLTEIRTKPKGRSKFSLQYTEFGRDRAQFLSALIPSHTQNREILKRRVERMRVVKVSAITNICILKYKNTEKYGQSVEANVGIRCDDCLQMFITEEKPSPSHLPYELISLIAEKCHIIDPRCLQLLYVVFNEKSIQKIENTFNSQAPGIYFTKSGLTYRDEVTTMRLFGHAPLLPLSDEEDDNTDRYRGTWSLSKRSKDLYPSELRFMEPSRSIFKNSNKRAPMSFDCTEVEKESREEGNIHDDILQYLGQHMISRFFSKSLGALYDPDRNWVNYLGSQAKSLSRLELASTAAFIFSGDKASREVSDLLFQMGYQEIQHWKTLPTTYRFEVIVSIGDENSECVISPQLLERIRLSDICDTDMSSPKEVTVLMAVFKIYADPVVVLHFNPWRLIATGCLRLTSPSTLLAKIVEPSESAPKFNLLASNQQNYAVDNIKDRGIASVAMEAYRLINSSEGFTAKELINRFKNRAATPTPPIEVGQIRNYYKYGNLKSDQIRLLNLYPGSEDDELQALVFTWPMNTDIAYNAVSYVWGDENQTLDELITPDGIVKIPKSTRNVLKKLRRENNAIILWIDAICINQQDKREKEQQIRLMPNIFLNSTSTLAIVALDEQSEAAITMLLQIQEQKRHRSKTNSWLKKMTSTTFSSEGELIPGPNDPIWDHIVAFFNRDWFRRAWIVQEAIVSPEVELICGKQQVNWTDIEEALDIIDNNLHHKNIDTSAWEPFRKLSIHRKWEAKKARWCLLSLLEKYRHTESTVPSDRFFALIGLAADANNFKVDYNTTLEDVVCRFAREFVAQGRGLSLLHRAGLDHQPTRFPSWIPNWRIPKPSGLSDVENRGIQYHASRGDDKQRMECIKNVLIVEGYIFDSIEKISANAIDMSSLDDFFSEVDTMAEELTPEYSDSQRKRIKWQVPIAGSLYPKFIIDDFDLEASYTALRTLLKETTNKGLEEKEDILQSLQKIANTPIATGSSNKLAKLLNETRAYTSLIVDDLEGWKFVVTKRKCCGIVPRNGQVGDMVSIICGGNVPFIVRKREASTGYYLIGESYIDGMMKGAAIKLDGIKRTKLSIH